MTRARARVVKAQSRLSHDSGKMTVAVTRARVLRWLKLESLGDGGSSQSAAVEVGLKQGFAGWSGHGCGRTGTQGTAGRGRM